MKFFNSELTSDRIESILLYTTIFLFISSMSFYSYFLIYKFIADDYPDPFPLGESSGQYFIHKDKKGFYYLNYKTKNPYTLKKYEMYEFKEYYIFYSQVELESFVDKKVDMKGKFSFGKFKSHDRSNQCIKDKCKKITYNGACGKYNYEGCVEITSISLAK